MCEACPQATALTPSSSFGAVSSSAVPSLHCNLVRHIYTTLTDCFDESNMLACNGHAQGLPPTCRPCHCCQQAMPMWPMSDRLF